MTKLLGKISSVESLGLVDGPGIRYVVFMQGCYLRCKYCHNPETWQIDGGREVTAGELVRKIIKYKPYFGREGGVTFSGGEPLLQPEFLLECLKLCKREGINTALDTAGVGIAKFDYSEILKLCDLVILDIKAVREKDYLALTNFKMGAFKKFLDLTQKLGTKLWLRQVILPGINDNEENIDLLFDHIKDLKNVERVELLPYKDFGKQKYKKLKINYPLENMPVMDEKECKLLEEELNKRLKVYHEML